MRKNNFYLYGFICLLFTVCFLLLSKNTAQAAAADSIRVDESDTFRTTIQEAKANAPLTATDFNTSLQKYIGYYSFTPEVSGYYTISGIPDATLFYATKDTLDSSVLVSPSATTDTIVYFSNDTEYLITIERPLESSSGEFRISPTVALTEGVTYQGSASDAYAIHGHLFTPMQSGYYQIDTQASSNVGLFTIDSYFRETDECDFSARDDNLLSSDAGIWLTEGQLYILTVGVEASSPYNVTISSLAKFFGGGTGTKDDPYLIHTMDQFYNIGLKTTKTMVYLKLMTDLVFNDTSKYKKWNKSAPKNAYTPIAKAYRISLDGNGHRVLGMYGSADGLFTSLVESEIKDLTLEKFYVTGRSTLASIALGCNFENIKVKKGTIRHILKTKKKSTVENSVLTDLELKGSPFLNGVGGIIGYCEDSSFTSCNSNIKITTNFEAAGIAYSATTCSFTKCTNNTSITLTGRNESTLGGSAAGFCVYADCGSSFNKCINYGNIKANAWAHTTGFSVYLGQACTVTTAEIKEYLADYQTQKSNKKAAEKISILNCGNEGNMGSICSAGFFFIALEDATIENSYNSGKIGKKCKFENFQGGIFTQDYGSNIIIKNVYNCGDIINGGASIGADWHTGSKCSNSFSRKGCADSLSWSKDRIRAGYTQVYTPDSGITELNANSMKNSSFVNTLNKAAKKNKKYVTWQINKKKNHGYPVLKI